MDIKTILQTAAKSIFVVDDETDKETIINLGGDCILYSAELLEALKTTKPKKPLVIAFNNDELIHELDTLDILYHTFRFDNDKYKDKQEALTAAVNAGTYIADVERNQYIQTSTAYHLQDFINGIADSVNTPFIPTGFDKLDKVLDGGLYEGLYIVGAISSLGKTTLVIQIADRIAFNGFDVLIFSLEMARTEIMAKSISRHTLQEVSRTGGGINNAKTTRGITTGSRYASYNPIEKELINNSIKQYSEYAKNIYIHEGIGNIGVEQIKDNLSKHIYYTGKTPVIVIDYIQILAPYNDRATDKQNTDKAVMELKRISRDFKTPIIGISSLNRESYKERISMAAFKESGAIEYSSDVLIGLQLKGAGVKTFNVDEAKKKSPRDVELIILKNRNGRTGEVINFNYYPMFNYFEEKEGTE